MINNEEILKHRSILFWKALILVKRTEDAEDLVQDTYIKALVNIEKFTPGTSMKNWLLTILYNTFINNYRHKCSFNLARIRTIDICDSYVLARSDQSYTIEEQIIKKDRKNEMQKAVEELPEAYKTTFKLLIQNLKYREIADFQGIPLNTVRLRIHNARLQIIKKLKTLENHNPITE